MKEQDFKKLSERLTRKKLDLIKSWLEDEVFREKESFIQITDEEMHMLAHSLNIPIPENILYDTLSDEVKKATERWQKRVNPS